MAQNTNKLLNPAVRKNETLKLTTNAESVLHTYAVRHSAYLYGN